MVKINFYYPLGNEKIEEQIIDLLVEYDEDFIPSISSSRMDFLKSPTKREAMKIYLEQKRKISSYLIAFNEKDEVIGFFNFIRNNNKQTNFLIPFNPHVRLDTMLIKKEYRGKGVGQILFHAFLEEIKNNPMQERFIIRSTWSTNLSQLHLFKKQGFVPFHHENIEGFESIQRLYFYKEIEKSV